MVGKRNAALASRMFDVKTCFSEQPVMRVCRAPLSRLDDNLRLVATPRLSERE